MRLLPPLYKALTSNRLLPTARAVRDTVVKKKTVETPPKSQPSTGNFILRHPFHGKITLEPSEEIKAAITRINRRGEDS
jgi:hypothetical protein